MDERPVEVGQDVGGVMRDLGLTRRTGTMIVLGRPRKVARPNLVRLAPPSSSWIKFLCCEFFMLIPFGDGGFGGPDGFGHGQVWIGCAWRDDG